MDKADGLPDIDLDISVTEIKAKPRKLKGTFTSGPAQDLRDMWGVRIQKAPLQDLAEGLDADNFEDWFEEWKKSRRSSGDELIDSMAQEMADETDQDILATLALPEPAQAAKIGSVLRRAVDRANQDKHSPNLHDEIMDVLRDPKGKENLVDSGILYGPRIPCPTKPSFWPSEKQDSPSVQPADAAVTMSKAPTAGEPAK